jgi:tetratricopeptide (TPR) repeat protein
LTEGRNAAQRAIALRPDLSQARVAMGIVRLLHDWDMHESLRELNQALAFDPGNASAWHWRALNLLVAEHTVEALDAISCARRLDPASLVIHTHAAMMLYFAGDFRGAAQEYGRVLETAPDYPEALWDSAWLHEREGRFDMAIQNLDKVCAMTAPNAVALGEIGANRAFLGQVEKARAVAAELEEGLAAGSHASAYAIANVYAGLGECDKVVHWLERAVEIRDLWLGWARIERRFVPFRAHPGFQACLDHVRLPGQELVDAVFD